MSPTNRSASWISLLLFSLSLGLCWPGSAAAKPGDDFRQHYNQGLRLYQDGQFADAIDELKEAYAIKQLPRLLYNIARAHFQLGHAQQSLDLFRQYLKLEPNPPLEIRAKVEDNMAQAQAMLDAAERLKAPPRSAAQPAPTPTDAQRATMAAGPVGGAASGATVSPQRPAKAGPILLNAWGGPAVNLPFIYLSDAPSASPLGAAVELALGLEVGFALNTARTVYLIFPPQAQLELLGGISAAWIMLPLGIEVDIPIRSTPGLFLYPRISLGYAVGWFSNGSLPAQQLGLLLPEFGLKYVIRGRVNLGFVPLSLPVMANQKFVEIFYRPMFHIGVNL